MSERVCEGLLFFQRPLPHFLLGYNFGALGIILYLPECFSTKSKTFNVISHENFNVLDLSLFSFILKTFLN